MNFTPAMPAQPATATTPAIAATPAHPPVLLPIFGMLDLRDERLLHAFDLQTPTPFLYLLSPKTYIKADAANVDADGLAEFASDARIVTQGQIENQNIDPQIQLTRRFLLMACDRPDDASHNCVNREFKSLMDQAAAASQVPDVPTPGFPVSTIGVFGNQTYLEARDHISLDGKPSEDTYLTGETWGAVVAAWKSSENGDATLGATPLLEVRRTQSRRGLPTLRMRVDFYTTSLDVLDAAQVMEGDEFYGQPHL